MIAFSAGLGIVLFVVGLALAVRARRANNRAWFAIVIIIVAALAFVPYSIWYYQRALG